MTYFIITGAVPAADGSPRRGVGKSMAQTGNDDTYLFCNVPEHHDLVRIG